MRLVVEQSIQQMIFGFFIAFGSRFIHARRQAVWAVTDLPTPLAAKQNRGSVLTVPLGLVRA